MSDSTATECLLFSDLQKKPVVLSFDQRQGSSDGGAVLLVAANRRYDLIESLAACLRDRRQSGKVEHSLVELMRQRIHGLACGYPDANDAARLGSDPMRKLLLGRDPVSGRDLASQPTLSRFENSVDARTLYRMGMDLARSVMQRHGKRLGGHARRVTIDLDPTDDATHGAQQLSFFNSHYDNWCYLPMMGFVSFDDEVDQYLCAAVLRPGNVGATAGAVGGVQDTWRKALERMTTDPEGAITLARSLLESVLKHILDERKVAYNDKADLPELYRLVAKELNLAPDQHTEETFKRILGGITSVVNELGSLRNRLGDAHGKGKGGVKPAPRHAELAVNLAGSIALFLVETTKK